MALPPLFASAIPTNTPPSARALSAYGRAQGLSGDGPIATGAPGALTPAGGFGALVGQMVGDTSTRLDAADHAARRQIAGKGNMIDLVTAIGAAETALDTVVAVRDRVVAAYGEIMRMQI